MRAILLGLLIAGIPIAAFADWDRGSVVPGSTATATFSGTEDTGTLNTRLCQYVLLLFDGANSAEVQAYTCQTGATTNCKKWIEDDDGDGLVDDQTLNGDETTNRHANLGVVQFIYLDGQVAPSSGTALATAVCK